MKARLRWAEGAEIKRELDAHVAVLLGPKTEADLVKPDKKKAKKVRTPAAAHACCAPPAAHASPEQRRRRAPRGSARRLSC